MRRRRGSLPFCGKAGKTGIRVSPYLNTERGLRVKTLEGREISPSLLKGMRPEEQITKRTPGVPTRPSVLLQHEARPSAPRH